MLQRFAVTSLILVFLVPAPSLGNDVSKNPTADYSKEAFVVEQSSDEFKFENDGSYTRVIRTRTRIQSDAGVQRFSVLKFAFQNASEAFGVDYVRVAKPDGSTVMTPPDIYQDMPADITRKAPFYSDAHEMQVAVKGLGVGDVLEYQAHWQHNKPLIPGQFWLEYNFAHQGIVLQETIEVNVPRGRPIKLKSPTVKPTIAESGSNVVYTWSSSNLQNKDDKQQKQEQLEQTWRQVRGRVLQSDFELSSFKTWEEVGQWYQNLQRDRVKPSAEIQAKAAELTKGLSDENAKIHSVYDFVSTNYRYIGIAFGIGRYQPHAASEVLANQYGDCKDKHTLFASLLNAAGIKAYPALISSTHELDPDIPSPGQFDHVITAIPQGASFLWLDTTTELAPFGLLIPPLRDKHALVISDDKPAALVATLADAPFPTLQKFQIQAKLSDTGVLEGQAENTDRGESEILFRAAFRMVPLPQWKDLVQRISYSLGFAGDVSDVNASQPQKTEEPFHFSYTYKRKDYSDWSNRRITPPLPVISLSEITDETSPTVPIWLGSPGEIDFRAALELPKGYTPDLPKAVHLKRDFADYDATYSFSAGVMMAERHMTIKLREVPASEYAEYRSFRKGLEDDYNTYTSLSIGRTAYTPFSYQDEIWNLPYSEKAEAARLYDDAREQFQRHDMQAEIASLQKAVEIDPKFIRAWLWLGEIYKASGQNDRALEAYRKAVEIDPQQPVSYKALGYTLMWLRKTDEAVSIWKQLAKLAPDKVDGYANWGNTLFWANRYQEALSPLESAVKISPDDAGLQANLALAYMRNGDSEKSRSTLGNVLKLNPSPPLLNNIAYSLAEQNVDLEKAKDYAEKAVRAEEEESSKLEISALQLSALAQTYTLANFWDTLGWVYFRMNDFERAEKYLSIAWNLTQRPTVGRHLAMVYENQGRKAAAIHVYQLAHAAAPIPLSFPVLSRRPGEQGTDVDEDLKRLGAKPDSINAQSDLNKMRTFALPRIVSGTASADFFLLFSPGGKVEARFVSGADSLKGAEKTVARIDYRFHFPDDGPARIARGALLSCYPYSGCSVVFMPPTAAAFPTPGTVP